MIIYNKNENGQPIDDNGDIVILKGYTITTPSNVIFFDNQEEFEAYKETIITTQWNKESYKTNVNELHNQLFESYYKPRDYDNRNEISLWLMNPIYGSEAQALLDWYWLTWELIKEHFDVVTEETANAEAFILSLPALYLN